MLLLAEAVDGRGRIIVVAAGSTLSPDLDGATIRGSRIGFEASIPLANLVGIHRRTRLGVLVVRIIVLVAPAKAAARHCFFAFLVRTFLNSGTIWCLLPEQGTHDRLLIAPSLVNKTIERPPLARCE